MPFPETMANLVLDKLRIVSPEDLKLLEKIAWARRAHVTYEPLQGSEAKLLSIPGKRSIITVSSNEPYRPRQRFSIAHELGHLEMHRRSLNLISCKPKPVSPFDNPGEDLEMQANQFASHLLLPTRFVKPIYENNDISFNVIEEIANNFEVSLTSSGSRYMRFAEEPVAFVISQGGRIHRFVPSHFFIDSDLFIRVNEGVERDTVADRLARGQSIKAGWHSVPATSWLRGSDFMRNAQVKEWSFFSDRFDLTLSLIWVDEELHEDW